MRDSRTSHEDGKSGAFDDSGELGFLFIPDTDMW